jgi:hypothetical protein
LNENDHPINENYPSVATTMDDSGYAIESNENRDLLDAPPISEVEAPQPASGGAVYGILVQEVTEQGYLPLNPRALFLAEVVLNSSGEPALIRRAIDSPKAELFQTGDFVFNNVPAGEYGLMIDLGFNEFPIQDDSGDPLLITIEDKKTQNLEQLFVTLP